MKVIFDSGQRKSKIKKNAFAGSRSVGSSTFFQCLSREYNTSGRLINIPKKGQKTSSEKKYSFLKSKRTFVAIGVFDGLHLGHQSLIRRVVRKTRHAQGASIVITFDPHPVHVLHPEIFCPLIISLSHRIKLIARLGVDFCWVIHFTKQFSNLTPEQFIRDYLVDKINPTEVFLGDDFRFGKERRGDLNFFQTAAQRYGFKVNIISAIKSNSQPVSSTRIRKLIVEGKLSAARRLLGRRVSTVGTVVKGDSRGKKLGFPTANVDYNCDLLPPVGVYLVYAIIGNKRLNAIANVGVRPSFNKKKIQKIHLEVYILDFERNIYGQEIFVEFIRKLRDEKKFPSIDKLIAQIQADEKIAREYFHSF